MRKPQSQLSLASLTEAEREQLADWVRREEYAVVRDRVNQPRPQGFGLDISDKPLRTLWAKVALLDLINSRLPADNKLTLAEFESLASREISILASSKNEKCPTLDAQCDPNPNPVNPVNPVKNLSPSSASSAPSAVNSSDPNKSETKNQKSEITSEIHDTILNTVHDIVISGGNTPTQLLALQHLADLPARVEIREQRLELDHQKFEHKLEMDTFRKDMAHERLVLANKRFDLAEKTFAFRQQVHQDLLNLRTASSPFPVKGEKDPVTAPQPKFDELGPLGKPDDVEAIRARSRKGFAIAPHEIVRRSHFKPAWKQRRQKLQQAQAITASTEPRASASVPSALNSLPMPDEKCSMLDAQWYSPSSFPSLPSVQSTAPSAVNTSPNPVNPINPVQETPAPSAANSTSNFPSVASTMISCLPIPEPLAIAVDAYTVRRAEEYRAHERKFAHLSRPPLYVTEYRHCPCGKPCPCPEHETEDFEGPFRDWFWSVAPHDIAYAGCLLDRGLPYRDPNDPVNPVNPVQNAFPSAPSALSAPSASSALNSPPPSDGTFREAEYDR